MGSLFGGSSSRETRQPEDPATRTRYWFTPSPTGPPRLTDIQPPTTVIGEEFERRPKDSKSMLGPGR